MNSLFKENFILFIFLLILNTISLFNMYNAPLISANFINHFSKQLIWFIIGYILLFITYKINLKNLLKHAFTLYSISIILLVVVLLVGRDINGAKCWLNIFGLSIQPSEIVKITLILCLIKIYQNSKLTTYKKQFIFIIKCLIITIIPSILVYLEPDTGSIINYLLILITILILANLKKIYYIITTILIFISIITFLIMITFYEDIVISIFGDSIIYRLERIFNFQSGYQIENALITIGASSFYGVGLNDILLYIPEAPTDFIFAFSCGNYGIISGILIIISYLVINIFILIKSRNLNILAKMFIYAYLSILIFTQIYNIGMNLGLLPIMGIPLPFLSYGGSSTIINYIYLGLTLNLLHKKKF